jgi:hypothetical protein
MRKLKYARTEGLDWRPLVRSQLQTLGRKLDATKRLDSRVRDLRVLREAMERFPQSVNDQQDHICRVTQKSRASFYRTLARHREDQSE